MLTTPILYVPSLCPIYLHAIMHLSVYKVDESEELLEKTSDPSTLTAGDISSASEDLQQLETSALSDENVS